MSEQSVGGGFWRKLAFTGDTLRRNARQMLVAVAVLGCSAIPAAIGAESASARASLRVVMDDNYPPYVFRDATGELNGYLVDSWKLWQEKTGVRVELVAGDWEKMQRRMAAGEADVIDTMFRTSERAQMLDFGPSYASIPVTIYAHADIGGISDLKTLRGFLVGVKAGDACADRLEAAGIDTLQRFPNYESLVQAAIAKHIRLFCLDEPPGNYLLYRAHAENDFRKAFELYTGEFHRAVHKGDVETLALVEDGFAAITQAERKSLREKWMGSSLTPSPYGRYLGYALLAAVLVGCVLALWGIALRRTVKLHTAQLAAQRASLRALVQTIPDLIWLKNAEGSYLACNLAFERFFGAKEAEIVGKTDYDFVGKELADFFRANDRKAIQAGGPSVNEEWLEFADGSVQGSFETIKTPILDARGRAVGVLGIARDITERKRSEAKILRLTRLYAALSECRQAIVHSMTEDALFERICRVAVDFGGMKMAWISRLDTEAKILFKVAACHDDTHYLDEMRLSVDADNPFGRGPTGTAVREDRPIWCQDFAHDPMTTPWHGDGAVSGWAASAALPLHRNGAVFGAFTLYSGEVNAFDEAAQNLLIEMARDIEFALAGFERENERRHAESALIAANRAYDELATRIPVGIYNLRREVGGAMAFDYLSPRFCSMLGFDADALRRDAALVFTVVHPDDCDEFVSLVEKARQRCEKFSWEGRVLVDGQARWMHTESQPTLQANGDVIWSGVQMDVTDRRQMENELAEANQRLQALSTRLLQVQEEERRTLARELHDEIGQSLTALKITLQSLNMRPETEALRQQIDMAIGVTDTALKQARQMSLDLRPAQLDDLGLPAAIRWNLERQCSLAGLAPHFSADGIPARMAEPVSIACYRISQEAITNVIRHARATRINITLTAGDGKITLEICDDGKGFDAEATVRGGMGMVSMQERAALAGGELKIETPPGGGWLVRATFPLSAART
ncbi:MAG: PAS domain S-box protein [Betaproteobacteria bacterium]